MDEQQTTRRERQIMDVLYAHEEATVVEIQAELPDPPSQTAIRTMLKILGNKGLVKRRKRGREHVYAPRRDRTRTGERALRHVIQTFFDGSLERAVATHLARSKQDLTDEELKRLAKVIRDARQGEKK